MLAISRLINFLIFLYYFLQHCSLNANHRNYVPTNQLGSGIQSALNRENQSLAHETLERCLRKRKNSKKEEEGEDSLRSDESTKILIYQDTMVIEGLTAKKSEVYSSVQIQISTAIVSKGCESNLSGYISSFRRLYIDFVLREAISSEVNVISET